MSKVGCKVLRKGIDVQGYCRERVQAGASVSDELRECLGVLVDETKCPVVAGHSWSGHAEDRVSKTWRRREPIDATDIRRCPVILTPRWSISLAGALYVVESLECVSAAMTACFSR